MTDTPQTNTDIADYRLAVERHLADLPAPIREDLLNGLEEHLAEVSADLEPGVPLSHLLGGPEAYAGELRDTVGGERIPLAERARRGLWMMADPTFTGVRTAADRFTTSAGVGDVGDFRKALKPGWWVLRGLMAAMLAYYFLVSAQVSERFPVLRAELFLLAFSIGTALLLVWLSLRLGARSERWGRRGRRTLAFGGAALALLFLASFSWVPGHLVDDSRTNSVVYGEMPTTPAETPSETQEPTEPLTGAPTLG